MRFIFDTLALVAVATLGAAHPVQPQLNLTSPAFEDLFRTHLDDDFNTVYKAAYSNSSLPSSIQALSKRLYYDPNDVYQLGSCSKFTEDECQFTPAVYRHIHCLDDCQKFIHDVWCEQYGHGSVQCTSIKKGPVCGHVCRLGLDRFSPKVFGAVTFYYAIRRFNRPTRLFD